jgi:hypothetical protein
VHHADRVVVLLARLALEHDEAFPDFGEAEAEQLHDRRQRDPAGDQLAQIIDAAQLEAGVMRCLRVVPAHRQGTAHAVFVHA